MKKGISVIVFVCCFFIGSNPLFATRIWSKQKIELPSPSPSFECQKTPSMVLLYGVQPVISNRTLGSTEYGITVHRDPFGWEQFSVAPDNGFIALQGSSQIVSNYRPIKTGADGKLYSYTGTGSNLVPTVYRSGTFAPAGPAWDLSGTGTSDLAGVSASPNGKIYMGYEETIGTPSRSGTLNWVEPVDPLFQNPGPFSSVSQLAVSPFGDIAVSGYQDSGMVKNIIWYDYKYNTWNTRILSTSSSSMPMDEAIAIDWDSKGNLAVAYSANNKQEVWFDYLDMAANSWTRERLDFNTASMMYQGTALAFDRFGNPVVASGQYLFYDPVVAPEPLSILFLGLSAALVRRRH